MKVNSVNYPLLLKPCAEALKASKHAKCAFCGGLIAYEPYAETIKGKKLTFHAKACAEAYKQKA